MSLIPHQCDLKEANRFIGMHHRHSNPLKAWNCKFTLGVAIQNRLVGVAIIGRPVNRHLDDNMTLEIRRLTTDGAKNACSFLLSRCCDVVFSHGYSRIITYTLDLESGSSLKGSGFTISHKTKSKGNWDKNRHGNLKQTKLDGREIIPTNNKICWV
ncbi:MAG: XF1762 family protein, partial [Planctomycetota bacterium]